MRPLVVFLLLTACEVAPEPAAFIAPLDGRTGLSTDVALEVGGARGVLPPDYPAVATVRLVDLTAGGNVPGTLHAHADGVTFVPTHPLRDGRRYAWTVSDPGAVPHGPETRVPESLPGTAVFGIGGPPRALDATRGPDGEACIVLSAPADGPFVPVEIAVDDAPPRAGWLEVLARDTWIEAIDLPIAIDVACAPDLEVADEAILRLWIDGDGPWVVTQRDESPLDAVLRRHRVQP